MAGKRKSSGFGAKARLMMLGISLVGSALIGSHAASASTKHHAHHAAGHTGNHLAARHSHRHVYLASATMRHEYGGDHLRYAGNRRSFHIETAEYRRHHLRFARYQHSGLQCVPYAREVSHIDLSGNAFLWWAEAADRYARGNTPVEGSVLNFRAIGRMPLGHVAVVTSVIDARTILVTQANWVRGTITNDVTMQDVSPDNDWTEVQVELGDSSTWGAAYPTYGFIYNKPAGSTIIAANAQGNEVAEAPTAQPVSTDAPDRNLQ